LKAEGKLAENPLLHAVAAVSVGVVDKSPMLDLCYTEDTAATVDLNLVMNAAGEFIELQSTGEEATFTDGQLAELLRLGKAGIRELLEAQHKALIERGGIANLTNHAREPGRVPAVPPCASRSRSAPVPGRSNLPTPARPH